MQVAISSLDLGYTIDTYGMFNGESTDESEAEYYREEYHLTDDESDKLEFDYNHPGVVEALAAASVNLLHNEFVTHGDGTITGIELEKTRSPQFYNYTTDSYTAVWTVDVDKLIEYVNKDTAKFANHLVESWNEFVNVPVAIDAEFLTDDDDKMLVATIDYYTRNEYSPEDYESSMFECESEAWYENMNLTPEAQAMIDAKQAANEAEAARIANQTNLDLEV